MVDSDDSEAPGYRARNACITIFADCSSHRAALEMRDLALSFPGLSGAVAGIELCPNTDRWHVQMFAEFAGRGVRCSMFQKHIGKACYFKRRSGKQIDCINYCKKGSQSKSEWIAKRTRGPTYGYQHDFLEIGEWNAQGKDSDLTRIMDGISHGDNEHNIRQQYPDKWLRYNKAIARAIEHQMALKPLPIKDLCECERVMGASWKEHKCVIIDSFPIEGRNLAIARYPKALLVSHPNQLSSFDPGYHDAYIFEDIFKDFRIAELIMDYSLDRCLSRGFENMYIRADVPRVILTRDLGHSAFSGPSNYYPHVLITQQL